MEDALQIKDSEGLDGFFDKVSRAMEIVGDKLIDVTPEAAEHLSNLVQFKGMFALGVGVMLLMFSAFLATVAIKQIKFLTADKYETEIGNTISVVVASVSSVTFIPFFAEGMSRTINFYNWLSATYPEGAIALKALEAVGINL